jgi:hypothetical protein
MWDILDFRWELTLIPFILIPFLSAQDPYQNLRKCMYRQVWYMERIYLLIVQRRTALYWAAVFVGPLAFPRSPQEK